MKTIEQKAQFVDDELIQPVVHAVINAAYHVACLKVAIFGSSMSQPETAAPETTG